MTPIDRFERRLPDQLDELAAARTPAYLDDLLARTSATRQRPRWAFPERWLPMTIALRRPVPAPTTRWLAGGLVLLVLLALAALAWAALAPRQDDDAVLVDSPRGGAVIEQDGDLLRWDPTTGELAPLVKDGVWPHWDPTGARLLFFRPEGDHDIPMVWEAATGTVTPLRSDLLVEIQDVSWSPGGDSVAVSSMMDGAQVVSILAADGVGASLRVDALPETTSDWPVFEPDGAGDGSMITRVTPASGGRADLYRIRQNGRGGSASLVLAIDDIDLGPGPRVDAYGAQYDLQDPSLALPDGRDVPLLAYTQLHSLGTDAPDGDGFRIHVFDGTTDHALVYDPGADDEAWPAWDPTGTRVAFQSYERATGSSRMVIASTGDGAEGCLENCITYLASDPIYLDGPNDLAYAWSPDGTELLVVNGQSSLVRRMDATTGMLTPLDWPAESVDWR